MIKVNTLLIKNIDNMMINHVIEIETLNFLQRKGKREHTM